MRRKPMRWRNDSKPWQTKAYELWRDGKYLATVTRSNNGGGWYWYCAGRNSACEGEYFLRHEQAQAAAVAYIKQQEAAND